MKPSDLTKDQWIEKLVKGTLHHFLEVNALVTKDESYSYSSFLGITREDLQSYFERFGYPLWDIPESEIHRTPPGGEYDTVWTLNEDGYTAYWLERGTTTPLFRSKSKEEFGNWWKKEILDSYAGRCEYPWVG